MDNMSEKVIIGIALVILVVAGLWMCDGSTGIQDHYEYEGIGDPLDW